MRNVVVTVVGSQRDAYGEENRIELVTAGQHFVKNGVDYIKYNETEISGLEGTSTVLKLYPEHVSLIRMGQVELKQEFRAGTRSCSTYVTPYGSLKMSVFTKDLEIKFNAPSGAINISYELEIDGQWQSANTLSITIREEG